MTASKYEVSGGGGNVNTGIASTSASTTITSPSGSLQSSQTSTASTPVEINAFGQSMLQPNSPSSSSSTSKNNGDTTFEPSVDMMVNDFDDEQTLEEEEALAAQESEDPSAELSNLQKESDMPIEELLALYNCTGPNIVASNFPASVNSNYKKSNSNVHSNSQRSSNKITAQSLSSDETKLRKTIVISGKDESPRGNGVAEEIEADDFDEEDDDDDIKESSQLRELYPETYGTNDKRLLRTISRQQSDEEEDGDYSPDEDEFKKTIMVGSEFQAVIPEGFFKYDDVLPYENEDKLLWDPCRITESETEDYLLNAFQAKQQQQQQNGGNGLLAGIDSIPVGSHLRDDEQALYLLLQCGHNTDEALRRKRINAVPSSEQMSSWSEDECRNFESGIRIYGKDFHTIQHTKVRTRSVGELVQFYYLWKKTERHDIFANKARLEKKKYNLHPGLTDYMDRFLEEQEGGASNGSTIVSNVGTNMTLRDRSLSPSLQTTNSNSAISNSLTSMNCLIQTDNKRSLSQGRHSSSTCSISGATATSSENSIYQRSGHNSETILKDPLAIDTQDATAATITTTTTTLNYNNKDVSRTKNGTSSLESPIIAVPNVTSKTGTVNTSGGSGESLVQRAITQ